MQIAQTYPLVTVGAAIFNPKNQVLLIKTHKWKDKYGLPGGKIEVGEKSEEALKREIKEETDLDIDNIQFVLYQDVVFSEEFYKPKHFIFLNYSCRTQNRPESVVLNEEAEEFIWVALEQALEMDLNQPTYELLKTLQKNEQ